MQFFSFNYNKIRYVNKKTLCWSGWPRHGYCLTTVVVVLGIVNLITWMQISTFQINTLEEIRSLYHRHWRRWTLNWLTHRRRPNPQGKVISLNSISSSWEWGKYTGLYGLWCMFVMDLISLSFKLDTQQQHCRRRPQNMSYRSHFFIGECHPWMIF
jgi:hypothetical protein